MHTNYKILRLLKLLKLLKLLQHVSVHIKPSSGSHIQCLAKITYLVPIRVSLLTLSVLWQNILSCCVCVCVCVCVYCTPRRRILYPARCTIHTHTQQVKICHHNTDNINNDTHIGTRYVSLAKHWMWLPDDGFTWTETCWSSFYNFN